MLHVQNIAVIPPGALVLRLSYLLAYCSENLRMVSRDFESGSARAEHQLKLEQTALCESMP